MTKPYLTTDQQIRLLADTKGLIIRDEEYAKQILTDIGYFSLIGGYKSVFTNPMTRKYEIPTTFEDVLSLYQFDESLRQLTFGYLNKIEQKLQNLIADSFCSTYGEKQSFYLSQSSYSSDPKIAVGIRKLINILSNIANTNSDHDYLVHQRKTYGNVPLWVTTHAMTFGQVSNMYVFLQQREKRKIAMGYPKVSEKALEQYLSGLTLFRNTCAHEERLFSFRMVKRNFPDTILHTKLGIPKKGSQFIMGKNDYFGLIIAFRYLLRKDEFKTYKRLLKRLIDTYCKNNTRVPRADLLKQMGMPENWEKITSFKI